MNNCSYLIKNISQFCNQQEKYFINYVLNGLTTDWGILFRKLLTQVNKIYTTAMHTFIILI